jgi:hypothetical protein
MNEIVKYFVISIVVWRVTHLITAEDGPFDLILKFRKLLGNSFLGKLMDCFYCASVWVGLAAVLCISRNWVDILILTFYYSGTAVIIEKLTNRSFK